jgi:hypothetical protein
MSDPGYDELVTAITTGAVTSWAELRAFAAGETTVAPPCGVGDE